jgi:spastin
MQSNNQDRILVMGATNRPYELDNAALRRFPKRIYIGLPDMDTRVSLINKLLESQSHSLTYFQIRELAHLTEGYSGSDLTALAKDAALGPIREKDVEELKRMTASRIRPLNINDFKMSLNKIRQSTPKDGLAELEKWNREYGDINT